MVNIIRESTQEVFVILNILDPPLTITMLTVMDTCVFVPHSPSKSAYHLGAS